ncbi:MAG: heme-binding domain-containing protein [Bacteroidia bacterium]|nr:heme-binding domain-containing protein [Bacteroidia bacterium]
MKKFIMICTAIAAVILLTGLNISTVSAQSVQKAGKDQNVIPANVMQIAQKSCAACHIEPGMKMALSVLNLTAWGKYAPEKQAAKANSMCKIVTKNKMPPKSYQTNNPKAVPTTDDVKAICDWAASLKIAK